MKTKSKHASGASTRRDFLVGAATGLAGATLLPKAQAAPSAQLDELQTLAPLAISTWPFGKPANEKALEILKASGAGLDAIEQGIGVTEADRNNRYVGLAGIPNADGVVQLDACIMSGPGHRAGSVAAVEGFRHPIAIARRVMETTPHVMVVGQGAMKFAARHGFERGPKVTPQEFEEWKKWKAEQEAKGAADGKPIKTHDTIAMVVLAGDGNVFGGCSTSGLAYKLAGRVGDSPIIGSGLYVDNEVGGAGATGVGVFKKLIIRCMGSAPPTLLICREAQSLSSSQ